MSKHLRNYLLITFSICWTMAAIFYFAGLEYGKGFATYALALPYMLAPGLVAIGLDKKASKNLKDSLWLRFHPSRWWIAALLAPILLALLALLAAWLILDIGIDLEMSSFLSQIPTEDLSEEELAKVHTIFERIPPIAFLLLQLVQAIIAGATINAFFALGEELGWRGLMLRELAHRGFWNSTAIIGVVWGIWHAPLILMGHNYPEHPVLGVGMMVLFCLALSPLFSLVTLRCRSTIAAAVMHGVLNGSAALSIVYLERTIPLITGIHGLIGVAILSLLNLMIFFFIRPTLSAKDWTNEPLAG